MKSLRQLRNDLVDIRLAATSVSLWHVQASLTRRANRAINDAIATYEFRVTDVYTSLGIGTTPRILSIPRDMRRIIRITATGSTLAGSYPREITQYRHIPTPHTNLLEINEVAAGLTTELVRVEYEGDIPELPIDLAVIAPTVTTGANSVTVTGGEPASLWPSTGYFELSIPFRDTGGVGLSEGTTVREVVRYDIALPTAFTGLTRAVEGQLWAWTQGTLISAVYRAPDSTVPVIMDASQAAMYEYWVRHRAMYQEYSGIISESALDISELLGAARAYEDKADRKYRRIKTTPQPSMAKVRQRRG